MIGSSSPILPKSKGLQEATSSSNKKVSNFGGSLVTSTARLHERASYPSFAVLIERFCRFSRSVSSLGDAEAVSFVEKMVELWYEHEMASTRRQARDLSFAKVKSQACQGKVCDCNLHRRMDKTGIAMDREETLPRTSLELCYNLSVSKDNRVLAKSCDRSLR